MCEKFTVEFVTNPFDNEVIFDLACEIFLFDDKLVTHFYIGDEIEPREETETTELVVNRTDANYQFFDLKYDRDLEYLKIF